MLTIPSIAMTRFHLILGFLATICCEGRSNIV